MAKHNSTNPKTADLGLSEADIAPKPEIPPPAHLHRGRDLTPTLISLAHTSHLFVEVLAPVEKFAMPGVARSEDGTVPVLRVRDLTTGDAGVLLCTTVLLSVLDRMGEYVGKKLEIWSGEPRPGKNYRDVRVWELEQ